MTSRSVMVSMIGGLMSVLLGPAVAHAVDRPATPSTFASVFSAAQGGDTISLASGSYGTFRGGVKPSMVTLRPQSGATASIGVSFSAASNIRLDGLTITGAVLEGATRNVTISNSRFTGITVIRTAQMANANVLLDSNTHFDIDADSYEGRITLPAHGPSASGVTISNSKFARGSSDGIQNGSNGTRIIGNEFYDIQQGDPSIAHSDPLQLYGSLNTVIRGNFIHDSASGIMAPDGSDHEVIEHNVIVRTGNSPIILGPDEGSIVRHNTLGGALRVCTCNPGTPSSGTVVKDNVIGTLFTDGNVSYAEESYNLIGSRSGGPAAGPQDITGRPTYVGGANPTTYAGFALAAGSPGKGNASDGADRGITVGGTTPTPTPTPTPNPTPTPTPAPTPTPTPGDTAAQAIWTAPTDVRTGTPVTLDGTASRGDAPNACVWSFEDETGGTVWETRTGCRLNFTFAQPGAKYVRLIVTDKDGDTDAARKVFTVIAGSAPAPSPTPSPTPTPTPTPSDTAAQAIWTAPTDVWTGTPVTLDGTGSVGDAPVACVWSFEDETGGTVWETRTGCKLNFTFQIPGSKYVKLIVSDGDGDTHASKRSFAALRPQMSTQGSRLYLATQSSPTSGNPALATVAAPRRITRARLSAGLPLEVASDANVGVSLELRAPGARRPLAHRSLTVDQQTRRIALKLDRKTPRRSRLRSLTLVATVTDPSGSSEKLRMVIRVARR